MYNSQEVAQDANEAAKIVVSSVYELIKRLARYNLIRDVRKFT